MQQGSIVLVAFPFSDLSSAKTRPALVISNKNLRGEDVIICGISSKSNQKNEIEIFTQSLNRGSLPLISFIKIDKIATVSKRIIQKEVALLNEKTTKNVIRKINFLLK